MNQNSQMTKEQIAHWRIWIAQRGADGDALCDLALKGLSDGPSETACLTCNGNPAVCATVPGLRHCEAANRESQQPKFEAAGFFQRTPTGWVEVADRDICESGFEDAQFLYMEAGKGQ